MQPRNLLRGAAGHPLHPPTTAVTIGAWTVGTVVSVLARVGVVNEPLTATAPTAVAVGLLFAVPTVVTGIADLLHIERASPAMTVALVHMGLMLGAALGYVVVLLMSIPTLNGEPVTTATAVVALASFGVLTAGGWAGGTLAYVYGVRVLAEEETPPARALRPESRRDVPQP